MTTATSIARQLRSKLGKPNVKTNRACEVRDIFIALQQAKQAKSRVRVYSRSGFVPNAYKYRCQIQFIEGRKTDAGWTFAVGWTGAQRSNGRGSLVVVQ